MATRIPLPGNMIDTLMKGVNTGSNMYSGIMHPILQREQLAQQRKNHLDNLALQQQAQARLSQLLPYQIQALKDAHIKSDPDYELNQLKKMMGFGGGNKQPSQQQSFIPGIPAFDMPENGEYPSEEQFNKMISNPFANQDVPQLNEGAVSPMEAAKGGGFANNMEALQKAIMNGYLKRHYGYVPNAQTPEQKQAAALDLFKQKEAIKAENKTGSGETLTAPIKTKYQNVIGGVTSARPIIKKLIEETKKGNIPGQMIGSLFKRDAQANYKGEISTLLDGVRNAYTIPNTDSGTAKAEDKVLRKNGETDANYAKRLQSILDQMDAREKDARIKLNSGNITAGAAPTVHLVGPNGEDYDVPESEVNAILEENPGVRRG